MYGANQRAACSIAVVIQRPCVLVSYIGSCDGIGLASNVTDFLEITYTLPQR